MDIGVMEFQARSVHESTKHFSELSVYPMKMVLLVEACRDLCLNLW
jgi:hypothetical protein